MHNPNCDGGAGARLAHLRTRQASRLSLGRCCCGNGEVMPPYRGNGIVVSTSMHHTAPHDCSGTVYGVPFTNNDNVALRDIWNGETWWGGHKPFCTLRCALDFARKAFRAGYRPQQLEKNKMTRDQALPYIGYCVDDALAERDQKDMPDNARLVRLAMRLRASFVAVWSYLTDTQGNHNRLDDDEAEEIARDYLQEPKWFTDSDGPCEPVPAD
jgi:hypothetical protein